MLDIVHLDNQNVSSFIKNCICDKNCKENIDKLGKLGACFVGFHKSFDDVTHTGLNNNFL